MHKYKHTIILTLVVFALGGCTFLMDDAEKGITSTTPPEDTAWLNLNVACSADFCNPELPHNLYYYSYEGMHDWSMEKHHINLDYIYILEENATFPFSKLYQVAHNQRQEDFPWPVDTRHTGGVYYDLNPGDPPEGTNPLGSDVDPQDRNNYIVLQAGIVNESDFTLYQNPLDDQVKLDMEILCDRDECLNNYDKIIKIVFYEGVEETYPEPFPEYYLELPHLSFTDGIVRIVYDTPADISDRNKVWKEGDMIGGAFLDMDDLGGRDVGYILGEDPYDMENIYTNTNGQITYSRLIFPGDPPESENWVHLTVDCDSSVEGCDHLGEDRDGATLKFYLYEGKYETTGEPAYYFEWENPVFPFEVYLEKGKSVDGEEKIWPVNKLLTGGAYLDMAPSSGLLTITMESGDPKDVCNRYYGFQQGPAKIEEVHLTLQSPLDPPYSPEQDEDPPDGGTVTDLICEYTNYGL